VNTPDTPTTALLVRAVDGTLAAIAGFRRPDLEDRLRQARSRLLDDRVRVLVVGEFKQGKSFMVNGLVGAPVCPVDDDIATAIPTVVGHCDLIHLTAVRAEGQRGAGTAERVEVTEEEIETRVAEIAAHAERYHHIEIGLPRPLLAGGLEIVDTPGVGGLSSVHGAATMAALPSADCVLLVSDASQEYTAPELEFLRRVTRVCPNVVCVLTKIDLYPEWRRIAELDQAHLKNAGVDTGLVAVSSSVRWHALQTGDAELDAESGFPDLARFLVERVLGRAELLARRSTVHDILAVTGQLITNLRTEQRALEDPEAVQALLDELREAQRRSAALKERTARWQITLADGVVDLNADIEYDLKDRMREIGQRAENEIDEGGDPTKIWEQICGWVEQEAAAAVSENFLWTTERARWLADQVADHFSEDRSDVLPTLNPEATDALTLVRAMTMRDGERWNLGQRALTGLRGSYIGVLMFGMLGTFVGLSIINPFSIGAGLLLGGKTISEERRRVIARRQAEARQAVRRYIDDAIFQVGKGSREVLRGVQRELRDHYTTLADQMHRSLQEAVRGAEKAMKSSNQERQRRLGEIRSEMAALGALQLRVREILAPPPVAQPAPAEEAAAEQTG